MRQTAPPPSAGTFVYGPVPSRRLGRSLGIDPIPSKTCNLSCVYCQLGSGQPMTNERRVYAPPQRVLDELREVLADSRGEAIDWITFVGSGEPTLHSGLGDMIRQVQAMTDHPVAVITNGSLLHLPDVRRDLLTADAVLPSLDAGTTELHHRINRPHSEITFELQVAGLRTFRQEYSGKLWVEVMLIRDLNDSATALRALASILTTIRPDEIHINLPTRPPAEGWVEPADDEAILRALAVLGQAARVVHPVQGAFVLDPAKSRVEAVIAIVGRHPLRQEELEAALGDISPDERREFLEELERSEEVQRIHRYGVNFWSKASSRYSDRSRPRERS